MPRMIHHDRMVKLFARALGHGAKRLSVSACRWDQSGNCRDPYTTEVVGRPRQGAHDAPEKWFAFTGKAMTMRVDILTRCRKCDNCKKHRASLWRYRAETELQRAGRSWFGTLTLSPIAHYRVLSEARAKASSRAVPWNTLTDEERFKRVAATSLEEVTRYLKRVRKQAGVPLRYICVTERHKSGLPHFHLLMHEVELKPVTHKILSTQWTVGFEKWRLVPFEDKRGARYVTKYLTKADVPIRVRASQHYGEPITTAGGVLAIIKQYGLLP